MTERDWKAVRRGPIYCSPACGANCTWAQYRLALREARAIVKALGEGWKIRVHENMGWFWGAEAAKGAITVDGYLHNGKRSYMTMIAGLYAGHSDNSPNESLQVAAAEARVDIQRRCEILDLIGRDRTTPVAKRANRAKKVKT